MAPGPEGVSKGTGFALAAQLTGASLTAGLLIYLGRALSPDDYGNFAFALSVASVATLLSDLGVSASAARFMAERRGDLPGSSAVLRSALRIKLALGGVTALLLIALAEPICSGLGSPGAVGALRWVAIALVGQSLFLLLFAAFEAVGRLKLRLVAATVESVTEVSASVALVALGAGAAGAGLGRATGYVVGGALGLFLVFRIFERRSATTQRFSARTLMAYAGPLLVVDAAFRVFASIDVLLVSAVLGGGAQVAAFEIPLRLAAFLDYPAAALAAAVAPRMARGGAGPDLDVFQKAMRIAIVLQCATVPFLLVWPEAIVHLLFGDRYPEAPGVLRALAPYVLLAGVAQLVTLAANYLGLAARRIPIAIAMLAVNAAVSVTLLPRIGIVAGAIGTGAAYLVWVPAHLYLLRKHADLPLGNMLRTTLRALVAGAVTAAVLAAFGTGELGPLRMVAGGVVALATYVAALLAVREVTRDELRAVAHAVRSRRRGAAA